VFNVVAVLERQPPPTDFISMSAGECKIKVFNMKRTQAVLAPAIFRPRRGAFEQSIARNVVFKLPEA
jgi:hypothetical protein